MTQTFNTTATQTAQALTIDGVTVGPCIAYSQDRQLGAWRFVMADGAENVVRFETIRNFTSCDGLNITTRSCIKRVIEVRSGKKWTVSAEQYDRETILHSLASDLAAKYIGRAQYVRRIERRSNYDGTQTYTVTYDNECRSIYTVDIY